MSNIVRDVNGTGVLTTIVVADSENIKPGVLLSLSSGYAVEATAGSFVIGYSAAKSYENLSDPDTGDGYREVEYVASAIICIDIDASINESDLGTIVYALDEYTACSLPSESTGWIPLGLLVSIDSNNQGIVDTRIKVLA